MADNKQRAAWGLQAVETDVDYSVHKELDTAVVDTLSNMKHLCRQKNIDFDSMVESADVHFQAEINPDELELDRIWMEEEDS